ncbi:MAG: DCC1-like thiol-disulfide oxidoreductase family protein [Tepidisphaeraceae bacterium]
MTTVAVPHRRTHPASLWGVVVFPAVAIALFALYWAGIPGVSSTFPERVRLSRAIGGCAAAALGCLAVWKWDALRGVLREFWYGVAHPMNLAIYRIALFATFLWDPDVDYDRTRLLFFSTLPDELRIDLPLMSWVTQNVPVNPALAAASYTLLRVFSLTAMIGLFSRTSAALAAIIGLYTLGVPQLFGQTNHYHHLIWFAAILATSRCGDYLSVDAVVRAAWRAKDAPIEPPRESRDYALPLRFVWLLMGLIYFFPGFWKYWHSGLDWAFSDNFKSQLHLKWMQLDGWMPAFRIDRYPVLYQLGALGAIVFELTFILFIFFPRLRWIPAVWGLMFHNLTFLLMRIAFITLQTSYVSLFNWHGIFKRIGQRVYRQPMTVFFDGNCKLSRRTVAAMQTFDLFHRVDFVNTRDGSGGAVEQPGLTWLTPQGLTADMHAIIGARSQSGFDAYRAIAWRMPLMWPILPLMYLPPVAAFGRRAYRRRYAAECSDVTQSSIVLTEVAARPVGRLYPVVALGAFLLIGNTIFGLQEERRGWPLSCYPPFSRILGPQTHVLSMVALDAHGNEIPWHERALLDRFSAPRYASLLRHVNKRNDPRQFEALWQVACRYDPALKRAERVRFYDETLWIAPERQGENPVARELLHEARLERLAMK